MIIIIPFIVAPLILIIVLKIMGRPWYKPNQDSGGFFDWYSFSHFLHGFLFAFFPITFAIGIEVIWEIVENSPYIIEKYRRRGYKDYAGDSIINSLSDLALCIFGWYVANYVPWWFAVYMFFDIELITYVAIKDNLILNIIKILLPISFHSRTQ